jgi:very-short-patch-repair endonuclease
MAVAEVSLPLDRQCEYVGLPVPTPELRFAPPRRWRFDFAFEPQKLAVEIEGGAFSRGRHTRGAGFIADMEKYNTAVALGWKVLRFTPSQVKDGTALGFIENVLRAKN